MGEHCLTDAGLAHEQDVGGVLEEPQGGQVADQRLVDAGLGGEVVVGDPPGLRQAGEPQPGAQATLLDRVDLDAQQPFQGADQGQALASGGVQHGW